MGKRRQEARGALQNRLRVFLSLMESGWFDNLLLDIDKADAIVKMLDAGVWTGGGGGCVVTKVLVGQQKSVDEPEAKGQGHCDLCSLCW